MKPSFSFTNLVTPAQAGVHHLPDNFQVPVMDSRLRGNDEVRGY
jgi:hypothetical protein